MIDLPARPLYTGITCQGFNGRFSLPANSRYSANARKPWQALGKRRMAAVCVSEAEMKEIPLTQGKVALVDDDDYEALNKYNWCVHNVKIGGYAIRGCSVKGGLPQRTILMHRQIIDAPAGLEVDHINGITLDNRRENLRLATKIQNAANRRKKKPLTSSQYIGVTWHTPRSKWAAQITVNWEHHHLGLYADEREAALAYDRAARLHRGEFAALNFPEKAALGIGPAEPTPAELLERFIRAGQNYQAVASGRGHEQATRALAILERINEQ